tara:strand:+ start:213 stop:899 length:687 start_codon:yes stop_codon:yes gene_type:complete
MIDQLQKSLGYNFNDIDLLNQAITHRSVGPRNNERMEFLGDAILGFQIADLLYQKPDELNEGQLSRMRSFLVKKDSLAEIGRDLKLNDVISLGQGELKSGGQNRDSIIADTVEAIIGAVYLDGGMESARALISVLFQKKLSSPDLILQQKDPKTQLQEILQKKGLSLPGYKVIEITGEGHKQDFYVECSVKSIDWVSKGEGGSRRKAEQAAAQAFIKYLEGTKLSENF